MFVSTITNYFPWRSLLINEGREHSIQVQYLQFLRMLTYPRINPLFGLNYKDNNNNLQMYTAYEQAYKDLSLCA